MSLLTLLLLPFGENVLSSQKYKKLLPLNLYISATNIFYFIFYLWVKDHGVLQLIELKSNFASYAWLQLGQMNFIHIENQIHTFSLNKWFSYM